MPESVPIEDMVKSCHLPPRRMVQGCLPSFLQDLTIMSWLRRCLIQLCKLCLCSSISPLPRTSQMWFTSVVHTQLMANLWAAQLGLFGYCLIEMFFTHRELYCWELGYPMGPSYTSHHYKHHPPISSSVEAFFFRAYFIMRIKNT